MNKTSPNLWSHPPLPAIVTPPPPPPPKQGAGPVSKHLKRIVTKFVFASALLLAIGAVSLSGINTAHAQEPTLSAPVLRAGTVTDTSILIIWDASPGAERYTVYVNGVALVFANSPSYIHRNLTPNTAYTFTVTADAGGRSSAPSAPLIVSTTAAPATPTITDLSFDYIANGHTAVTFTTSVAGRYQITYTLANDEEFVATKAVTVSAEQVGSPVTGTLLTGQGYVGTVGITFSDTEYASDTIATRPSPPTLVAGDITDTSIAFSWTAQRSATEYLIYRGTTLLTTTSDLSYIHTGLTPDTEYFYTAESRYGTATSARTSSLALSTLAAPANQPPVIDGIDDLNVVAGTLVTLTFHSATDPDGNDAALTYRWTQASGTPDVTLSGADTATATFTAPSNAMSLSFRLTVTDEGGASSGWTTNVVVTAAPVANQPPVADAGDDFSVTASTTGVTLDGSDSTDSDGTIATYAWVHTSTGGVAPSTAITVTPDSTNPAMATFTAPDTAAELVFTLTVTDDDATTNVNTDTNTVTITVTAPALSTDADLATLTVTAGGNAIALNEPVLADTLEYTATVPSDTTTVTIAVTSADANAEVDIDFGSDVGTGSFTMDFSFTAAAQRFAIEIHAEAGAPRKNYGITITRAVADTTPPLIVLTGPDTVILTEDGTYTEQGATAEDDVDGTVDVTIGGNVITETHGTYTVTYNAMDAAGNAAVQVTRTVIVQGRLTFINPLRALTSNGATVDGVTYAKDGDILTLNFVVNQALENDPTVTIAGQSAVVTKGSGNDYTATYTVVAAEVSDGAAVYDLGAMAAAGNPDNGFDLREATSAVQIDVTAPTVNFGTIAEGEVEVAQEHDITFSEAVTGLARGDFSSTGVAVTVVSGVDNAYALTLIPSAIAFTLTLDADSVTDAAGNGNAEAIASGTALPGNQFPIANAGAAQDVTTGATVTLDGSGSSDPDNDALTYSWTHTSTDGGAPSPLITLTNPTTASPTFTADTAAVLVFTLRVTDGTDASTGTVTITVTAPVLSADADLSSLTISEGTLPTFAAATTSYAVDVDNDVPSVTLTPTTADTAASVTVDGATVTSTEASNPIDLAPGVAKDIRVVVTAEDGTEKPYTIIVTRAANTAPSITGGQLVGRDENGDTTVATYTATDAEGDTITWSVTGADAGFFTIAADPGNANLGVLTFNTVPDFETQSTYSVTIVATDDGEPNMSSERAVTVTLENVDETGTIGTIDGVAQVGMTLTAPVAADITDPDGAVVVTGHSWNGAGTTTNAATYAVVAGDLNNTITVTVTYTDGQGTGKMLPTAATSAVVGADALPTPRIALNSDTGVSDSDRLTNDNVVNVLDVAADATWEYSIDGGATDFTAGSGSSFTVPEAVYTDDQVRVRQKTDDQTSAYAGLAAFTLDVTPPQVRNFASGPPTGLEIGTKNFRSWRFSEAVTFGLEAFATSTGVTLISLDRRDLFYAPTAKAFTLRLAANSVLDLAGNEGPTAAASVAGTALDTTPPSAVFGALSDESIIGAEQEISLTFSELVTNVSLNDFSTSTGVTVNRITQVDPATPDVPTDPIAAEVHTIHFTPTLAAFTLTLAANAVSDLAGLTGPANDVSASGTATAPVANTAPRITTAATQSVAENTPTTTPVVTFAADDDESNTITWALTGADAGDFTLNAASGVLTFNTAPNYETKRSYAVTVTATDNGTPNMPSAPRAVTIAVTNVDEEGSVVIGGDLLVGATLTATVTEEDGAASLTYQWQSAASGGTYTDITSATSATYILAATDAGKTLQVVAMYNDGFGDKTVTSTITGAVPAVPVTTNQPPVANAGDLQTVAIGATVTLDGSASTDSDGTIQSYEWVHTSTDGVAPTTPITVANGETSTFTAPDAAADLDLVFTLTVTDDGGATNINTDTNTVTITVTAPVADNQPPVANAGALQTVAIGATVTLDGTASTDSDGTIQSYVWVHTSTDGGAPATAITVANGETSTFTAPDAAAELVFTLTVTDDDAATHSDTVTITVTAPVVTTPFAVTIPPLGESTVGNSASVGIDFARAVTGLAIGDFTVSNGAVNSIAPATGSGTEYVVTYTPSTAGAVTLTLAANAVTDGDGNPNLAASATGNAAVAATQTTSKPRFTATTTIAGLTTAEFDEPKFELGIATLLTIPVGDVSIISIAAGSVVVDYEVVADTVAARDTRAMTLDDATDAALRAAIDQNIPSNAVVTTTSPVTADDSVAPTVDFGTIAAGVVGTAQTHDITFSEAVTGLAASDFSASTGVTVDSVSPDPALNTYATTYTITFTPNAATFKLILAAGSVSDLADNTGPAEPVSASPDSTAVAEVILSEIARAIADQNISAIVGRVERARTQPNGTGFNFAGQQMLFGGNANANGGANAGNSMSSTLDGMITTHAQSLADDTLDMKTLLGNSDFSIVIPAQSGIQSGYESALVGNETGISLISPISQTNYAAAPIPGTLTFWGSGDYRNLSGEDKEQTLDWDGDLFSLHLGVDAHITAESIGGVALSWSEGEIDYNDGSKKTYDTSMTSINPYFAWANEYGEVWMTAGYGEGELERDDGTGTTSTNDLSMQTFAIGGNSILLQRGADTLRVKGEISQSMLEVDANKDGSGLSEMEVDANRARLSLESTNSITRANGARTDRKVELGARHDGGDGVTGTGIELALGLRHVSAAGLSVEGKIRGLLGHKGDINEWGISGTIKQSAGADGQGFSFALSPGYGDDASDLQRLWEHGLDADGNATGNASSGTTDADGNADPDYTARTRAYSARLDARIGYGVNGFTAPSWLGTGSGLLTPYTSMTLSDDSNRYRLGVQWKLGERIDLDLVGEREDATNADDNKILLKGEFRF